MSDGERGFHFDFTAKLVVTGIIMVVLIVSLLWVANSWVTASQGHALLIVDLRSHEVNDPIMGPAGGLYADGFARMIGLQQVVDIYYETDKVEMWTEWRQEGANYVETGRGDYPAVITLSKDGLAIEVDILVRWSLDPNGLVQLYKNYPNLNWKDIGINSIIREKVRDVVSGYSAIDIISQRQKISSDITAAVQKGLSEDTVFSSVVKSIVVDLRNIDPSVEFVKAIERKLAAEQAKLQAEFEYERALTLAKADAESKVIIANGTREAISTIISITGNSNSTEIAELYMYLMTLQNIAPNVKFLIVNMGQGTTPIMFPMNSTTP